MPAENNRDSLGVRFCAIYCRCHLTLWFIYFGLLNAENATAFYVMAASGVVLDLIRWPLNGFGSLDPKVIQIEPLTDEALAIEYKDLDRYRRKFVNIVWFGVWSGYLLTLTMLNIVLPAHTLADILSSGQPVYGLIAQGSYLLRFHVHDLMLHGFPDRAVIIANGYSFSFCMYFLLLAYSAFYDVTLIARYQFKEMCLGVPASKRKIYPYSADRKKTVRALIITTIVSVLFVISPSRGVMIHWPGQAGGGIWMPQSNDIPLFFFKDS